MAFVHDQGYIGDHLKQTEGERNLARCQALFGPKRGSRGGHYPVILRQAVVAVDGAYVPIQRWPQRLDASCTEGGSGFNVEVCFLPSSQQRESTVVSKEDLVRKVKENFQRRLLVGGNAGSLSTPDTKEERAITWLSRCRERCEVFSKRRVRECFSLQTLQLNIKDLAELESSDTLSFQELSAPHQQTENFNMSLTVLVSGCVGGIIQDLSDENQSGVRQPQRMNVYFKEMGKKEIAMEEYARSMADLVIAELISHFKTNCLIQKDAQKESSNGPMSKTLQILEFSKKQAQKYRPQLIEQIISVIICYTA